MATLFSTFCRRKSRIFRFTGDKRSLIGNSYWVSFLRIPYSLSNFSPLFNFLLYVCVLFVECVCIVRKLIFNKFISVFSSNVNVPLCKGEIFQVCRGQEQIRRRYFCCMFISYSLLSSISHFSSFLSFIFRRVFFTGNMY